MVPVLFQKWSHCCENMGPHLLWWSDPLYSISCEKWAAVGKFALICVPSKDSLVNDGSIDGLIGVRPSVPTTRLSKKPSLTLGEYSLEGAGLTSFVYFIWNPKEEAYTIGLMMSETAPIDVSLIRKISRSALSEKPTCSIVIFFPPQIYTTPITISFSVSLFSRNLSATLPG